MPDELQSSAPEDTEGSVPSNDAADVTPSSSAPDDRKEILDRLAREGRERVANQQKIQYLEGQLGYAGQALQNQSQQLNYIQSQMSRQQWQDFENRLAQMRPEDQANERARVAMEYSRSLEQRLMASQRQPSPPPPQQQRQETDEEYSTRKANEILAKVNSRHRLTGDSALTIKDMPNDAWDDPETFAAEAGVMAKQRAASREDGDMSKPDNVAKLRESIKKDLIKELGANRSMSPSASAGDAEPASEEVAKLAAQSAASGSGRLKGPAASIAELRKNREAIAAKIGQ